MFLILEVSAMIITGVTAVISMFTSFFKTFTVCSMEDFLIFIPFPLQE